MAAATRKSLASRAGAAAKSAAAVTKKVARATAKGEKVPNKKPAKTSAKPPEEAPEKVSAKKAPAKKAQKPAQKTVPKKTAQKTAEKTAQAPAKKTTKKAPTVKAAPAKKVVAPSAAPAEKATASQTATKTAARPTTTASPDALVVLEQESPWTKAELKEVRTQLTDDVKRLTAELAEVEGDLAGMIENSGEGAGHDQADVGSASFERDQEMVIVNNARDMLEQSQHALERIADGSYGQCENCTNPIGKNRLMAFPRATLCLSCKQREERR